MPVVFKKDDQGNVIMTEEQLNAALAEQAKVLADEFEEKLKAVAPQAPLAPAPDDVAKSFLSIEGESVAQRQVRVTGAVQEIKLGKMKVNDGPKEVRFNKWMKALAEKDWATVRGIAEFGYEKALTEGAAADGGNLVPVEFATDLKVAMEQYITINDCTRHDMTTNEKDLRSVTTKPLIYQVAEGVAVTEATPKFGKPILTAKAWAGLQVISKELMQDNNVGLYDKLVTLFGEAFAEKQSYEILDGSVYGGILQDANTIPTTLDGQSIQTDVTFKKLVTFANSLSPGALSNGGKFYMHRTIWGFLQGIEDNNGRPIVSQPWSARDKTLLGYPVVLDEKAPNTDAAGTAFIVFGNLKWVDFGMRQDLQASMLTEGTVASINLAEKRSLGLIIDTRWGLVVSMPAYLAVLKTAA